MFWILGCLFWIVGVLLLSWILFFFVGVFILIAVIIFYKTESNSLSQVEKITPYKSIIALMAVNAAIVTTITRQLEYGKLVVALSTVLVVLMFLNRRLQKNRQRV